MDNAYECPILVWMVSVNRNCIQAEYDACHALVKECVANVKIPYAHTDMDSFRNLLLMTLPLLMMRYRRIPREKWRKYTTKSGRRSMYEDDLLSPERILYSMMEYSLAQDRSLLGMAMLQGPQKKVNKIGLSIEMLKELRGIPLQVSIESQRHKLTPRELATVMAAEDPNVILSRRLAIILGLKYSYAQATGQNATFVWPRLEFDPDNNSATLDGHALTGWEFRLFRAKVDMEEGGEEDYQCCCAFLRSSGEPKIVWYDDPKQLATWVQFINIDQMMKVVPKLAI